MELLIPELSEISAKLDTIMELLGQRSGDASRAAGLRTGSRPVGMMAVKEVAEYLGISKATVYQYASSRRLPFVKLGTRLLFRVDEIDEWVEAHARRPLGRSAT